MYIVSNESIQVAHQSMYINYVIQKSVTYWDKLDAY